MQAIRSSKFRYGKFFGAVELKGTRALYRRLSSLRQITRCALWFQWASNRDFRRLDSLRYICRRPGLATAIRFCLALGLVLLAVVARPSTRQPRAQSVGVTRATTPDLARLDAAYGKLPLLFEANRGQTAAPVRFVARGQGATLFLTARGAVWRLPSTTEAEPPAVLRLSFARANPAPRLSGLEPASDERHYFIGNEPEQWRKHVPSYARVKYEALYPGIDLIWHGAQRALEYDLVLAPGARPEQIKLAVRGARALRLDEQGALVLQMGARDEVRMLKPVAWQEIDGQRRAVECAYRLAKRGQVAFQLGAYNRRLPLVIDPVLAYSTFVGGTGGDSVNGLVVDNEGNAYLTGYTDSADFPGPGPLHQTRPGGSDIFVAKLNPTGTALVWGTWLGGSAQDTVGKIALDASGNVYVTGYTLSSNFPLQNALQTQRRGSVDAFVAKLAPNGASLLYSTLLGGTNSDYGSDIALDGNGNACVVGITDSFDFPLQNPLQEKKAGGALYVSNDAGARWTGVGLEAADKVFSAASVFDLVIDPTNSAVLYAGTDRGLYKSTDGGAAWARVNSTPALGQITQLAIEPRQPQTLYALSSSRLYKSTDAGLTWVQLQLPFQRLPQRFALAATTPVTLYAYDSSNSFYKSPDGGTTWTQLDLGFGSSGARGEAIVVDPITPTTVYLATNRLFFKSVDGGMRWFPTGAGLANSSSPNFAELAISRSNPQVLYAVQRFSGLYRSEDGGANFRLMKYPISFPPFSSTYQATELAVDAANPNTIYLTVANMGAFKSTDGGETWRTLDTSLASRTVRVIVNTPDAPQKLYAGATVEFDAFIAKLNANGSALVYGTYLGGAGSELANALAVDAANNIYVTGSTLSLDFPVANAYQRNAAGNEDAYVAKLNAAGTALVWSTYLGGSELERPYDLALNAAGNLFVAGLTNSSNFPVVRPLQATNRSVAPQTGDGFITRFSVDGKQLDFSTYLGGSASDYVNDVAVDAASNVYVTGSTASTDFPVANPVQAKRAGRLESYSDTFVAKLRADGAALGYSTYLGGDNFDYGQAIAVDARNSIYVGGGSSSHNFPLTPNALRSQGAGPSEGFVTKLAIQADLALTMADLPDPVRNPNQLTYTLQVVNHGPDAALDVQLTDTLPATAQLTRVTTTQGACTGTGTLTCALGTLNAKAKAVITIEVQPTSLDPLTNRASVTSSTADANTANNSASETTRVTQSASVFGRVATANGEGVSGVTVAISGLSKPPAVTDAFGHYQFAELGFGSVCMCDLTPSKPGFVFNPPSRTFGYLNGDTRADFTAVECAQTIAPRTQTFGALGGAGSINVVAPDGQCPWTARSNVPWIKLNNAVNGIVSTKGNAAVSFTVEPTVGARSGTLIVAGHTFTVWQEFSACPQPAFVSPAVFWLDTIIAGYGFPNLLVRDINGDRVDDVFLLTRKDNLSSVTMLRGNASGGFAAPVTLLSEMASESQALHAIELRDLNGDGRLDLLATYRANNGRLLVALGNGSGGFGAPTSYALNQFPSDLVVADFNNDGKLDVAALNFQPGVLVLLNNGAGGLGTPSTVNLPSGFNSALRFGASDFNQDGKADLAVLGGSSEFIVLLGNGTGGFTLQPVSNALFSAQALSLGDFNGDGRNDVLLASVGGLQLWPGKGDGSFDRPVDYRFPFGNNGTFILAEDFSGDGRKDIVLPSGSAVRYVKARGDGRFDLPRNYYPGILTGDSALTMTTGDYNRDGRPDVYLLGVADSSGPVGLVVMLSNGGEFAAPRGYPFAPATEGVSDNFGTLASGDLNRDGLSDVAVARGRHSVEVLLGRGRGEFGPARVFTVGQTPQYPSLRDLDKDGDLDIVVVNQESGTLSILLNDERADFQVRSNITTSVASSVNPNTYSLDDFNNDGSPDLLVKGRTDGLALWLNDGTGNFREAQTGIAANFQTPWFVTGDFNSDSNADVAIVSQSTEFSCAAPLRQPALLFGDGRGGFSAPRGLELDEQPLRLFAADLNLDGRTDLLFSSLGTCVSGSGLRAMLASGGGNFVAPIKVDNANPDLALPTIGDVNGDGRPDIVLKAQGAPRLILNQGDGTFVAAMDLPRSRAEGRAVINDFNQDGAPDLAFLSEELVVMLNRGGCFVTSSQPNPLITVSAASYALFTGAREAIVATFGVNLAQTTLVANTLPLPTSLGNTSLRLKDSAGVERAAPLFFVSPTQINFLIPPDTAPGVATITARSGSSDVAAGTVQITPVAPGLFTANASGLGLAAAAVLQIKANGTQSFEPVARLDATNRFVPVPIDLSNENEAVYLLLFGTGLRQRSAQQNVVAQLGGSNLPVQYAGAQGGLVGLDQINLQLPRSLQGRGEVELTLLVDGRVTNPVKLHIK
jgi:uncharacterized protein (TIGR03437 family)